jgi:uncharacterized protein (TIGR00299 family) protein
MLLAALLDAGASRDAVQIAVDAVLSGRLRFEVTEVRRAGLRAQLLRPTHDVGQRHELEPRPFRVLAGLIDAANIAPSVQSVAQHILATLGQAEARVHGVDLANLVFDELGDDDTVLDVVGIAAALESLDVKRLLIGPIPASFGAALEGDHGRLPLPAPATLELLRGFTLTGGPDGELVTPTAAAVFAALGTSSPQAPEMLVESIGYGAGSRNPPSHPNVVRVVVGAPMNTEAGQLRERRLTVLETNIDDLSAELVADAVDELRRLGALDVWTSPIYMKKGRPGVMLSALCEPEHEDELRHSIFEWTSTFGVRATSVRRSELERRFQTVTLGDESVRVKVGILGEQMVSTTPEHDDVLRAAKRLRRPARQVYEDAIAATRRFWVTQNGTARK